MLNVFRENLKHLKWLLWIVAASMTLYLGAYFFRSRDGDGAGSSWAARVDGEPISTTKYFESARRMDDYYRQLMGEQYERVRSQLNLGQQVIQSLVDERIQIHEARALGLEASSEEVARYIQNDPRLKDPGTGQFIGKERYAEFIRRTWPGGVSAYEQAIGDMLTAQKWAAVAGESAWITDAELEEAFRSRSEKTKIDYAMLPAAGRQIDTDVSPAQVDAWYAAHRDSYFRAEARKIRFVVVDRQALVSKVQVTEDEIQAYYGANQAQFTGSAGPLPLDQVRDGIKRQIEQQRAQELAASEARRIRAEIASAQDLPKVAERESLPILERIVPRDDRLADLGASPQFRDLVFSLSPGAVSDPVGIARGIAILTTDGTTLPAGVVPLEEVRDRVRSDVLNQRTRDAARAAAVAALAKGKGLAEAAKALGVEVRKEIEILPGQPVPGGGGASPELDAALFGSQVARGATGVAAVPAGALLYEVTEVQRFDPAAFAAQKDTLREELLAQKRSALVQGILARLREKHQIEINTQVVEASSR